MDTISKGMLHLLFAKLLKTSVLTLLSLFIIFSETQPNLWIQVFPGITTPSPRYGNFVLLTQ